MRLERYLKRRGLNASQLAEELGLSRQVMSNRLRKGHIVGKVGGKYMMYHPRDMIPVKSPPKKKEKSKPEVKSKLKRKLNRKNKNG